MFRVYYFLPHTRHTVIVQKLPQLAECLPQIAVFGVNRQQIVCVFFFWLQMEMTIILVYV